MDKRMSEAEIIWATKERKALDMTISKMLMSDMMTKDYLRMPGCGLTKEEVDAMFNRHLEHFRRVCHKPESGRDMKDVTLGALNLIEANYMRGGR